jgi:hypothetical protein
MPPEIIQQVSAGQYQHWYGSTGAIIGYIVTLGGVIWKIANLVWYLRTLYVDVIDRICSLEKSKEIDDIHYETIKNMVQDLRNEVHDFRRERGR